MTDDMERAQALEAFDRDAAIATHMRSAAKATPTGPFDGCCADCGEPIDPQRLAALGGIAMRCIDCATRHEHRARLGQ